MDGLAQFQTRPELKSFIIPRGLSSNYAKGSLFKDTCWKLAARTHVQLISSEGFIKHFSSDGSNSPSESGFKWRFWQRFGDSNWGVVFALLTRILLVSFLEEDFWHFFVVTMVTAMGKETPSRRR